MRKQPIFVAVDTNNIKRATQIVNATNKYIYGVKFGLEFFCSKGGREAVKKFKNKNVKIFLDLKLKDIPNTVYKAIKSLKDVSPDYLTIHASGGLEMMKAAKKAQSETNKKLKILAVTINLTNKQRFKTNGIKNKCRISSTKTCANCKKSKNSWNSLLSA